MERTEEIKKGLNAYDNKFSLEPPETTIQSFAQMQVKRIAENFEQRSPEHVRTLLSLIETQRQTIDKQHILLEKYESMLDMDLVDIIDTQKKALKQLPLELNKLVHEDGDTLVWSDVEAFLHEYIQESLKQE